MDFDGAHIPLTEYDFELLRPLIEARTGLSFPMSRRDSVEDRLAPLVRERGLASFLDYYYYLEHANDNGVEWRRVHSALAVGETYFWREFDQFETISEVLLPALLNGREGRVRIWHAGCATGEEPYTHAMHLIRKGYIDRVDLIATDADNAALEHARIGRYGPRSFRMLPDDVRQAFFTPIEGGRQQLDADVLRRVRFHYLNLADAHTTMFGTFNIIMCRNVFIYFSPDTIRRVATTFHRALVPGGHLFLGASESLLRLAVPFSLTMLGRSFAYLRDNERREP